MAGVFFGPEDPRWKGFLEGVRHDVYHRPEYVRMDAARSGGKAVAFLGEVGGARCLIPLVESPIPPGLGAPQGATDLASPYGYGHPLVDGDPAVLGACLRVFAGACRERGSVCAFLRSNPLLSPTAGGELEWNAPASEAKFVTRGETLVVQLGRPLKAIRGELRSEYKRHLNRLTRLRFHEVFDDWSLYDKFVDVYHKTMERLGAKSSYYFDRAYFDATRTDLREQTHLVTVLSSHGSNVVAAGLFFREEDRVQYHLSGWDPAYAEYSPSKLVLWSAIRWANETGASCLHLGGGLGAREDELFHFKQGFTDRRLPYYTLGVIADRATYDGFVGASGAASDGSYFPAYRLPHLQAQQPAAAAASG